MEAGTEQLNLDGEEGELSGLGLAGIAAGADDVSAFDGVVDGVEGFLSALIVFQRGHELELGAITADVIEHEFALAADGLDASGYGDEFVFDTRADFGNGVELGDEVGKAMGHDEFVGVGVAAGGFDLFDLSFAVGFVLGWVEVLVVDDCLFLGGSLGLFGSLQSVQ